MEKRGQINAYEPWKRYGEKEVYTINLADGVTSFIHFFEGKEFASIMYRLRRPVLVTVTRGWYRPSPEEFSILIPDVREHVLNAGLLCADLATAIGRQMKNDPVLSEWDYETFQEWCAQVYGARLK